MDGNTSMMLSVKNPFGSFVKYNIDMVDAKGNLHHTSSRPVLTRGAVFESWPHPIQELRITNFRFLKPEDAIVCTDRESFCSPCDMALRFLNGRSFPAA
jgi:hypothetical protein